MEQYIILILAVPVVWFLGGLSYQMIKLFRLWLKLKLQSIKEIF